MLAVTDVIELHYTTITPQLLLDRTALTKPAILIILETCTHKNWSMKTILFLPISIKS